jgi:tetratricopeptide (TPR) repeat protein
MKQSSLSHRNCLVPAALLVAVLSLPGCGGGGGGNQMIVRLSQEIKANSENAQAYANRGLAYLELEEYEKALTDFKQAVELQGNSALFHVLCARAYLGLKLYDAALARAVRARTFNVNLPDIYWVRGQILQAQGQDSTGQAQFDTSVGIDRKKVEPYLKRGEFYLRGQRFAEAAKDANKAISLDSNSAAAFNLKGRVFFVSGRYDSAFTNLERARVLDATNPHFLSDLGRTYYERQDRTSAQRYFNDALKYKDRLSARELKYIKGTLAKLEGG